MPLFDARLNKLEFARCASVMMPLATTDTQQASQGDGRRERCHGQEHAARTYQKNSDGGGLSALESAITQTLSR